MLGTKGDGDKVNWYTHNMHSEYDFVTYLRNFGGMLINLLQYNNRLRETRMFQSVYTLFLVIIALCFRFW